VALPAQSSDRDLQSIAEARALARAAKAAQAPLAELTQEQVDAIVTAMAHAVQPHAESLARLAVEETGFGVVGDKVQKNLFAAVRVFEFIRPMRTVGVVGRHDEKKIVEIAEPFGVVAAIVPSTNPTSTAVYKALIALKARCPIVISPHPSAAACITRTVEIMAEAALRAGAPAGAIGWMRAVTLEGTQELMRQREVAVILATGGMGLVRAAYSAGKPAYGVGPGNAPCYIERSADVAAAARDIVLGKTFDNGLLCSSPNSVVVDEAVSEEARRQFEARGARFLSSDEAAKLAAVLVTSQRLPNPKLVGRAAREVAAAAGIAVADDVTVLVAPLAGVGREHPLSIEKLCPVLSWYVVEDWRQGCERCIEVLRYGGMGHTMSVHSQNDDIVLQFGLKKPAFRICVNTPTTHGSIGLTTGLDPAMTLGCGGWGGNITSDNISPRHLLNTKRLAYGLRPAAPSATLAGAKSASTIQAPAPVSLPRAPDRRVAKGISDGDLSTRVDRFLAARGYSASGGTAASGAAPTPAPSDAVALFVCEEDVRYALRVGRTITVGERSIITPSARDLGAAHDVFRSAGPLP
jgi:acetaldehyde dehydrogenase (acetylating)